MPNLITPIHEAVEPLQERYRPAASDRDFSSTQINLPEPIRSAMLAAGRRLLPQHLLAEDGWEENPHVTLKYGLHTVRAADVAPLLATERPIRVTMGPLGVFEAKAGAPYDVVYVSVHSPDLHRLNAKISAALPVTDTHPVYLPHATLGYIKPGAGQAFKGMQTELSGLSATVPMVLFSSKDRSEVLLPLQG